MPKAIEDDLVSESEYENVPLEQAINESFGDLQAGLNELQVGLFSLFDHDIMDLEHYVRECRLICGTWERAAVNC